MSPCPLNPLDCYPALLLPLVVMLFEKERQLYLLYTLVAVSVASWDGLAVSVVYWVLAMLPRYAVSIWQGRRSRSVVKGV